MKKLNFVTGNDYKAAEVQAMIDIPIERVSLDIPEIQSLDVEVIATLKAKAAFEIVQQPVLVEDVSLVFHAMHALPGPLIKWFLKTMGAQGLCTMLNSYTDRSATAEACYVLYDGKDTVVFRGEMKGVITLSPKGNDAYGWSGIFIPDGEEKSWAELSLEEKKRHSMRYIALCKLRSHLELS